jgi:hypothetical protein
MGLGHVDGFWAHKLVHMRELSGPMSSTPAKDMYEFPSWRGARSPYAWSTARLLESDGASCPAEFVFLQHVDPQNEPRVQSSHMHFGMAILSERLFEFFLPSFCLYIYVQRY